MSRHPQSAISRVTRWFDRRRTALFVFAVLGCSGEATGVNVGTPATVTLVSGGSQSAVVGRELPTALQVRVTDGSGTPVAGAAVTFSVTSGGGSVSAASVVTTADGIATDRWTLGTSTAAPQTLEVRAVTQSGSAILGIFHATATPDAPAALAKTAGDAQQAVVGAAEPVPLGLTVKDQYGNPVPGVAVAWSPAVGTVAPTSSTSNAAGVASTTWTLGTQSGSQSVSATAAGMAAVSFTANASPGTGILAISAGDGQSAVVGTTLPVAPRVSIKDSFGNPVPGVSVTFGVGAGNGSVSGGAQVTDSLGSAQVGSWTLGTTAGGNTLTVAAGGVTGSSASVSATGVAGDPAAIALVGGSTTATVHTSVAIPPSVKVTDKYGNSVGAGVFVNFKVSKGGGTLTDPTQTTNAAGVATLGSFTVGDTAGFNSNQLVASYRAVASLIIYVSGTPGPLAQLKFAVQPATAGLASPITPAVQVALQDAYGNALSGSTAPVSIALGKNPGGATLSGGSAVAAVNGVATFAQLKIDKSSTGYTLVASASGPSVESAAFDVTPGSLLATAKFPVMSMATSSGLLFLAEANNSDTGAGLFSVSTQGGTPSPLYTYDNTRSVFSNVIADGQAAYALTSYTYSFSQNSTFDVYTRSNDNVRRTDAGNGAAGREFVTDGTWFFYSAWVGPSVPGTSGVFRIRPSDGAITNLVPGVQASSPARLAATGGQLYYTDSSAAGITILRTSVDSGPSTPIASGLGTVASSLVITGGRLYWVELSSNALRSVALTGGAPVTHATGVGSGYLRQFITDGTYLYANDGALRRISLADFSSTALVASGVDAIALDTDALYWSQGTLVMKMPR